MDKEKIYTTTPTEFKEGQWVDLTYWRGVTNLLARNEKHKEIASARGVIKAVGSDFVVIETAYGRVVAVEKKELRVFHYPLNSKTLRVEDDLKYGDVVVKRCGCELKYVKIPTRNDSMSPYPPYPYFELHAPCDEEHQKEWRDGALSKRYRWQFRFEPGELVMIEDKEGDKNK